MLRCAAYARFSSDLQRATSIDDQIAVARAYAARHGWQLLPEHIYADAGISGASIDGRPGLQRLLAVASDRPAPFDVLLVDDSSRIARDLADAVRIMQLFRFAGVRVIYISQGIDSASEQAETLVAVHGLVDGLYLREMRAKIKRGLTGQLDRGFSTGGATYGYRTRPVPDPSGRLDPSGQLALLGKQIEIYEPEARVVREVFEWFAAGAGVQRIVSRVTRQGSPAPRGGAWKLNAVKRMLTNERYCGLQIWGQRTFERRPGTSKKALRWLPRLEWQVRERPDLRIVSDELWERVQERRAEARKVFALQGGRARCGRNAALQSPHLFSGLLRCGICGSSICVVSGGHGSPRYGCPNSWKHGLSACTNRLTVRAKVADPLLLGGLQREVLRQETLQYLTKALAEALNAHMDQRPRRRADLAQQRAAIKAKLQRLIGAVEDAPATASLLVAIEAREAELQRIEAELAALEEDLADPRLAVMPTWVRQQLEDLPSLLRQDVERTKAELRRLGVQFRVSPVQSEGARSFLRAVGETDLSQYLSWPTTALSPPRSEQ